MKHHLRLALFGAAFALASCAAPNQSTSPDVDVDAAPPTPPTPTLTADSYLGYATTASPLFTAKALSPSIEIARQKYLEEAVPLLFFVEENGEYATWWMCESKDDCSYTEGDTEWEDEAASLAKAKAYCEERMLGATCFLDMKQKEKFADGVPRLDGLRNQVVRARDSKRWGAGNAKGKIVYFPGFGGWSWDRPNFWRKEDSGSVPAVLSDLNAREWDVDVVNIAHHDRYRMFGQNEAFAALSNRLISEARAQGYQRVAFAGTSRGGNEILKATKAGARPDSILLLEPDGLGPTIKNDGSTNKIESKRVSRLIADLSGTTTIPTAMAFFADSRWYGALTADDFDRVDQGRKAPFTLIARPDGYSGHSAGGTDRFSSEFIACFDRLFSGEAIALDQCRAPQIDDRDPAMWVTRTHVEEAGLSRVSARRYIGRVFCGYDAKKKQPFPNGSCITFGPDSRSVATSIEAKTPYRNNAPARYTATGYCKRDLVSNDVEDVCYSVYPFQDKIVIMRDGTEDVGWYVGTAQQSLPAREWVCSSGDKDFSCARTGG